MNYFIEYEHELQHQDIYAYLHLQDAVVLSAGFGMIICLLIDCLIDNKKKKSWGITFVNSFICSLFSAYYIYTKREEIITYLYADSCPLVKRDSILTSVDKYSAFVCVWFAVMNVYDLVFGLIFYREYLGLFTAILHHPFYIWLMLASITGNVGFAQLSPFSSGLVFFLLDEVPTFVLSLGMFFPRLKTHLGYGVSFFALRICYHTGLVYLIYEERLDSALYVILPTLSLIMHFVWFKEWLDKYGRRAITWEAEVA